MIDNDWKELSLGEVLTLQRGFDLPHRERQPGNVPIVSSSGISDKHSHAMVSGPGVVTGRYGTIGQVFFIDEDFWPLNTTLYVRDFKGNDPLFTSYLLRTLDFQSHSGKTGVPGVNRNDLHQIVVRQPPLPEQRAIAAALSDMDALIAALDRLIAKKRAIKQGAMQQLLTGQTRLPGFSGEWEVKALGDILDYEQPVRYLVKDTEYVDTGTPVLTAGKTFILGHTDEQEGIYTNLPVIVFDDFTIASRYVDFPFKIKSSAIKLLTAKSSDVDLGFVFGKMQILPFALGDHKRYYISEYQHIKTRVPSPREQRAIAAVLSDMDAEIDALEARCDKTQALKQGMMQELLTGKTRLL